MELKRKKNAAGNMPTFKRMTVPVHSSWRSQYHPSSDYFNTFPDAMLDELEKASGAANKNAKTSSSDFRPNGLAVTEPLPAGMRPSTPPPVLQCQPESAQLTMYRHYQYIHFYR